MEAPAAPSQTADAAPRPVASRASRASVAAGVAGFAIGLGGFVVAFVWSPVGEPLREWFTTLEVERWPRLESLELQVDARRAPEFAARARMTLADVRDRRIPLLLNRSLSPTRAATAGTLLQCSAGKRLRSAYHREARVVWVDLGREPAPAGEELVLELEYSGRGADGSEERDWRGILLLAPDELRMSEQTVFYPQIPTDADGPGIVRARGSLEVLAPEAFEVFVAGRETPAAADAGPGARARRFEFDTPSVLCVLGGLRTRLEVEVAGTRVVTLLSDAHAHLGPQLVHEARATLRFFSERFGPAAGQVLGIVEIKGRGSSYNWASQGVAAFESGAFEGDGLPEEKLGHELAHLWWGQAVASSGEGERFLTEGLAEYASWRWVEETRGADAARRLARTARDEYLDAVHGNGEDPALARVGFRTPGYFALAYGKGALALRAAEHALGRETFDSGLRRYVEASRTSGGTLDGLSLALWGSRERAAAEMPWLRRDGHAHFELADLVRDESAPRTSGSVVVVACPEGSASVAPARIDVRFAGAGEHSVVCAFGPDGRGAFAADVAADALVLDAGVHVLGTGAFVHSFLPFTLARSDPPQGARDVPYALERIVLEFDRPLAPLPAKARPQLRSALIAGAQARKATWPSIGEPVLEADGKRLVLPVTQPLPPDRDVAVVLGGVLEDAHGVPIGEVALLFRTRQASESDPPVVVATSPHSGSTGVACDVGEIRIEFSEPMHPGRGYSGTLVRELEREGWKFPLQPGNHDSHWEQGGRVLVYELSRPLAPASRYILPLRGGFQDLSGNPLGDFDYSFETR